MYTYICRLASLDPRAIFGACTRGVRWLSSAKPRRATKEGQWAIRTPHI